MTDTDQEREDEVLRRMLATPPTPHKGSVKRKRDQAGLDNVVDASEDAAAPSAGWQESFAEH